MEVRLTRGAFLGYLAIALLIGLAVGTALLVSQRVVLMNRATEAEQRLEKARDESLGAADEIKRLALALKSAEGTVATLKTANSKLASDLAATRGDTAGDSASTGASKVTFLSRSVSPPTVEGGKPITLQAKIKGRPDKVRMRVVATSGGYDKTYSLAKVSTSGETQTWRATVNAPGDAGEYRYHASAWIGSKKFEMPGVSAWVFLVQ